MSESAVGAAVAASPPPSVASPHLWSDAWRRLARNRAAMVGLAVVVLLFLVAIFGPWITPYDFLGQDLAVRNQGPSWSHWLGTDELGRDVLSRVIYGARTALFVAVVVTGVSSFIGVCVGAIAAYLGGWVDAVVVWVIDITLSVPSLLLVVVINTSLRPPIAAWMDRMYAATLDPAYRETVWIDFILVFGSMALVLWPPYARLVRAQVLSIRNQNYVMAAQSLGLPTLAILRRHVVPNALGPLIVAVSAGLGTAMVLESSFSFLGVGVRPPMPSWGNMISAGLKVWRNYPHLLAIPALVLGVATIAFSLLGDGLNDALNPRQWKK